MTDEIKEVPKEERPNVLKELKEAAEEARKERAELEKLRDEIKAMKEEDILSGKAPTVAPSKPVEEDAVAYYKRITGR